MTIYLLKRTTDGKTGYSDLGIWQIFSQKQKTKNKVILHYNKNGGQYLLPMMGFELSSKNKNFGKRVDHHKLDSFSVIKEFSDVTGDDISMWLFGMLYNLKHKYLKDLHNS